MASILIIESSDLGAGYTAQAVQALGHEPIFLCTLDDYRGDPLRQILAYRHLDLPTGDLQALLVAVQDLGPVAGVMTFADTRLKPAAQLAELMAVPGLDPAVVRLKGKNEVTDLIAEWCPPSVMFDHRKITVETEAQIAGLFQNSERVIFKPFGGAGGLGVFTIDSPHLLGSLAGKIFDQKVPTTMDAGGWIAQAFVVGELVSLEGYVQDGIPHFLGWTNRQKRGATETQAGFPVDAEIPGLLVTRGEDAIRALVQRSGMSRGYFHVEFILNYEKQTLLLIDANMGRLGGGPMGELLALAYARDPVEIYRHAIEIGLFGKGRSPYEAPPATRRSAYSILYGIEKGGTLLGIELPRLSAASVRHTQILETGAKVTPLGLNDWSWIGILTGTEAEVRKAASEIRIETDDGWLPACY